MQVLHQVDEVSSNKKKISPNYQFVTNLLSEAISEISDVQSDLNELQKKSALLEIKNQHLIIKFKTILEDINSNFHLKDIYTQSDQVEVRNKGINCNIHQTPFEIDDNSKIILHVDNHQETDDFAAEKTEDDQIVNQICESVEHESNSVQTMPLEETKVDVNFTEPDSLQTYSKKDMLTYLARYKIDFLKFLQCNRNNIEQIAGGCPELIRSFSCNSDNEDKVDNKRKTNDKSKRCKTKSMSEVKPGVIDTGDNFEDPSLKSSLYDDLDFHEPSERVELKITDTAPVIAHTDVGKIGGEKRINAIGIQSKMNLLKSRTDGSKSKKIEAWKTELTKLETRHDSHYPGSEQHEPIKKERDKQEMMKPLETVFTVRMKERLNKKPADIQDKQPDAPLATNSPINLPHTLTVVKYDLSTPDDPSFLLDLKSESASAEPMKMTPTKTREDSPKLTPPVAVVPEKSNHNREKSKHKHKHSSKKKVKKIAKDLEDGEII